MPAKLTDYSPMPWGAHKNTPMINVPAAYLLYCRKNFYNNQLQPQHPVSVYIEDNLDVLQSEIKKI